MAITQNNNRFSSMSIILFVWLLIKKVLVQFLCLLYNVWLLPQQVLVYFILICHEWKWFCFFVSLFGNYWLFFLFVTITRQSVYKTIQVQNSHKSKWKYWQFIKNLIFVFCGLKKFFKPQIKIQFNYIWEYIFLNNWYFLVVIITFLTALCLEFWVSMLGGKI